MQKFHLVLLIHAHQPVGNFDDVIERAYAQSYEPFVDVLSRHPSVRVGLHFSGSLLEWMERAHPEFLTRLAELAERGQIELIGGGFYEPILAVIPPEDGHEQIVRLADYLEKRFARRPRGAWLAERVWEPALPGVLARAGVEYTLVDDNHFLGAGFEPGQLHGYYLAEDCGATVRLMPGLKSLRYLIPYGTTEEVIAHLREAARGNPSGMAVLGDDCEKFGVWPGTHDHCYRDLWLERFFAAIEANAHWLEAATPGEALAARAPLGRADLPTASYMEMSEWSLPTEARRRFHALSKEFAGREDLRTFLRGGIWRNFFTRYSESNLLHKKMLHVSRKVRVLAVSGRRGRKFRRLLEDARPLVLRAQANDAYWHGVFGGLYAPHLRTALWQSLVRAETLADAAQHRNKPFTEVTQLDFDADGRDEVYLTSDRYSALLAPADGGTVSVLDFRPAGVTLINSLMRRPEAYHARLGEAGASKTGGAVSIHEQSRVKEEGLERLLRYDRWARNAFRLLVFDASKNFEDYQLLRLDENAALAGGAYAASDAQASSASVAIENADGWRAEKKFSFEPLEDGFQVRCDFSLTRTAPDAAPTQIGLELVFNLLAADAHNRYFVDGEGRHPLSWAAATPASELRIVDEWQNVALTIQAPGAREFWVAPIETVSESEEGFERVYQGSQILCVWPAEFAADATWRAHVTLQVQGRKRPVAAP